MASPNVTLIRTDDLPQSPWKNGAGTTAEIAVASEGVDRPRWRFSVATLEPQPAQFSSFPGYRRIFTVIGPVGVRLQWPTSGADIQPWNPTEFPGNEAPGCRPAGPTAALNVMVDAAAASASVRMHDLGAQSIVTASTSVTLVLVRSGRITAGMVDAARGEFVLVRHERVLLEGDASVLMARVHKPGQCSTEAAFTSS